MKKIIQSVLIAVICAVGLTGCIKPPKVPTPVEIKPNETAWVIPLDGSTKTDQAKFNSVEFLNGHKVATKRIWIDKVEKPIGRFSWEIEWIDAVRVITVDRSLVTREWTFDEKTGTSAKDEGIRCNTKDNIGLDIGITITVCINEDDASTYLYYHGERTLASVMDDNIRSFVTTSLSQKVASMDLADFQNSQNKIYADLAKEVTEDCKANGITVKSIGNARGWRFIDQKIQDSINASYIAQQDNKTAEMEQNAKKTRNATDILNQEKDNQIKVIKAKAEAEAAKTLEAVKEAAQFQNDLQVRLLTAQAQMEMAQKWDGKLPSNILPANSPMLMNLGATKQ